MTTNTADPTPETEPAPAPPAAAGLELVPLSEINNATLRRAYTELHLLVAGLDFVGLRQKLNADPSEVRQLVAMLTSSQAKLMILEDKTGLARPGGITPEHLVQVEGQMHLL